MSDPAMNGGVLHSGALALASCPRCGFGFSGADGCAGACGARGGCALLCCPGCGASFPHPQRSRLAYWLAQWLGRRRAAAAVARNAPVVAAKGAAASTITLATLPVGTLARVSALPAAPERARQFAALGLLPGTALRVRQRHPAFVLEFGETTLALDRAVAREIAVEPA